MYHYYRDKEHLLADIAESYIERLQQSSIRCVRRRCRRPRHLRRLIELFMAEYEHSAGAPSRAGAGRQVPAARTPRARAGQGAQGRAGLCRCVTQLAPQSDRAAI